MSERLVIHSARLIDDGTETPDAWVAFADGRVAGTGTGAGWRELAADDTIDARGRILSPGFVDIHVHGGGGHAFDDGAEAILAARALHRAHGTTSAVVSLVSAPADVVARRLAVVAELIGTAGVLGAHLEGPFLDPGHRGAHDPAALAVPTAEHVDALLGAGRGAVRQVTIAPDLPGALDAIRAIVAHGAVAAVGHTGADAALTARAFDAGATVLTHAFNAMPGLHHRAPGPVGAALADDRVTLEVIADGVHLHPTIVRTAFAAAPGRVALVTDAMSAAGAADGRYELGGLEVTVSEGVARLDEGTIAGSTLTQDAALRIAVAAGVELTAALQALTATPARAIGRTDLGRLHPGAPADAVLLDDALHVAAVWTCPPPPPPAPRRGGGPPPDYLSCDLFLPSKREGGNSCRSLISERL
jgi:N-acetylglucosamine-6-phosphate deacetylase